MRSSVRSRPAPPPKPLMNSGVFLFSRPQLDPISVGLVVVPTLQSHREVQHVAERRRVRPRLLVVADAGGCITSNTATLFKSTRRSTSSGATTTASDPRLLGFFRSSVHRRRSGFRCARRARGARRTACCMAGSRVAASASFHGMQNSHRPHPRGVQPVENSKRAPSSGLIAQATSSPHPSSGSGPQATGILSVRGPEHSADSGLAFIGRHRESASQLSSGTVAQYATSSSPTRSPSPSPRGSRSNAAQPKNSKMDAEDMARRLARGLFGSTMQALASQP